MSDGLLILAGLVFLFIIWVWTGGPSRPISFAGPFITPITTTGDVQTGYGGAISTNGNSSSVDGWSLKGVLGQYEGSAPKGSEPVSNPSSYRGKVMFTSGTAGPTIADSDREYVSFRNSTGAPLDITGWAIVSSRSASVVYIPQGAQIARAGGSAPLRNIVLNSGDEAIVMTGRSPAGSDSYRETACTQYLRDRRGYDDCVNERHDERYFFDTTWLVYLNRARELWGNDRDTLKLLDREGKLVDQYVY